MKEDWTAKSDKEILEKGYDLGVWVTIGCTAIILLIAHYIGLY